LEVFPIASDHWIRPKVPKIGLQASSSHSAKWKNAMPSEKERNGRKWGREDVGACVRERKTAYARKNA